MSLPDGSWTSLDGQPTDLVSRVAARATAEPDLAAVVTANGDELSYTELLERATAASAVVRERSRGDGVAVITDRGPSSAIALLAAAMVRCPVALVDDSQSLDRIEALLDRLDLPVIRAAEEFCDRSSDPPQPGDPILILTTSGSTSDPKVALVQSPRWLVDSSTEHSARCQLVAADAGSYANVAKYTLAMWRGGTVVALGPEDSSVTGLVDAVVRFGVTRLAATP
ncbi:MAG: AMP-binding protein, partial [Ilumatobacteraceae bacterium]